MDAKELTFDAERELFCEQTIKVIETRITDLLGWINNNSSSEQDEHTAKAIRALTGARAALLVELEASRK